jgi:Vitamin B12 dependent methionine synthase, activation domain
VSDYLGLFANAAFGLEPIVAKYKAAGDDYSYIMAEALADRCAPSRADPAPLGVMHMRVVPTTPSENVCRGRKQCAQDAHSAALPSRLACRTHTSTSMSVEPYCPATQAGGGVCGEAARAGAQGAVGLRSQGGAVGGRPAEGQVPGALLLLLMTPKAKAFTT